VPSRPAGTGSSCADWIWRPTYQQHQHPLYILDRITFRDPFLIVPHLNTHELYLSHDTHPTYTPLDLYLHICNNGTLSVSDMAQQKA